MTPARAQVSHGLRGFVDGHQRRVQIEEDLLELMLVASESGVHRPNPPVYHATILSPQNNAAAPPAARKGPNGIGSLRPARPEASSTIARAPPQTTPTNRATSTIFQPRKAPSIAPSLRSPPPMPPPLNRMTARNRPPARTTPTAESSHETRPVARLAASPARTPGTVITSGIS